MFDQHTNQEVFLDSVADKLRFDSLSTCVAYLTLNGEGILADIEAVKENAKHHEQDWFYQHDKAVESGADWDSD